MKIKDLGEYIEINNITGNTLISKKHITCVKQNLPIKYEFKIFIQNVENPIIIDSTFEEIKKMLIKL